MKVMWICNSAFPHIAKKIGLLVSKPESWISGLYEQLKYNDSIEVIYLFPAKSQFTVREDNIIFESYYQNNIDEIEKKQIESFEHLINKYLPEVIHIFGTEYAHTYSALKACENIGCLNKAIIHIQGLTSLCAKHYFANLPNSAIHSYTFRDFIKKDNIYYKMHSFEKRSKYEIEALKLAKNVIGRTDMDYAYAKKCNPNIKYYFCNELLRPAFYKAKWDYDNCEKHSIFVGQSGYPIKGFHLMLEAMNDIVKHYPNAKLYTTGNSPFDLSIKEKLKQSYYNRYIGKLIIKYGLRDRVVFLGRLDECQMCERFCNSNVFVSCSSIENSPNSVAEAMILGVPVVASDVGGVKNMMIHNTDGYIYQFDAPYMLAYYIMQVFEKKERTLEFSKNSRAHASDAHNIDKIINTTLDIYKDISEI